MMNTKILAGAVPPPREAVQKEKVIARPKGGRSNFNKKKIISGFFGKK